MSEFDVATAPAWRVRLQIIFAWFGLVDDPRPEHVDANGDERRARDDDQRKPDWARILFAVAIPLWASDRVDGWWYASFVALGAVSGVIELVRWRLGRYDRGWFDLVAGFLQLWPMLGLIMFIVFGDDVGAGPALAYAMASGAALLAIGWGGIWLLARGASSTGDGAHDR